MVRQLDTALDKIEKLSNLRIISGVNIGINFLQYVYSWGIRSSFLITPR